MSTRARATCVGILIALLLVLAACSGAAGQRAAAPALIPRPTSPPLPPLDQQAVKLGARIYQDSCASCHGADGQGEADWKTPKPDGSYPAPPHDASGHTWHHGDGLLYQIIRDGGASLDLPDFKSNMPAFAGSLSDAKIRAVLEFLKSTWPEQERQTQWLASQNDPLLLPAQ